MPHLKCLKSSTSICRKLLLHNNFLNERKVFSALSLSLLLSSSFSLSLSCFHKHHKFISQKAGERERLIKKLVFQSEAFTDNQKLLELRFQGFVI